MRPTRAAPLRLGALRLRVEPRSELDALRRRGRHRKLRGRSQAAFAYGEWSPANRGLRARRRGRARADSSLRDALAWREARSSNAARSATPGCFRPEPEKRARFPP